MGQGRGSKLVTEDETRRFRSVPRSFPRLLSGLGNFMFLFGTLGRAWRPFPPSKTSGPPKRPSALRPRPCDLFSTRERSRSPARDTPVHGNPHSAGEHEPLPLGAFRFQGLLTSGARLWALSPVRSIPERHWAPRAPAPSVPRAGLLAPLAGAECISFMVLASHLLLPRKRDQGVAHPSRFSEIFLQHPPWLLHPFFTFMPNFANSYALVMEAFPVFGQVEREHARKDEQIILAGSNIDAIGLRHAEPLL